jgi:hypothetical protein
MSKLTYARTSPYASTPQTSWYLGHFVDRPVPPDSTDVLMELDAKYIYRPDLFSYDRYQTPAYYWVFMRRNLDIIREVNWDFLPGIQLFVPTLSRLRDLGY